MPHNKSKYWEKGFWVWRGTGFDFFSNIYLPHSYFFICVYIKKNTSHMSQQPINAVDTGNLSLHIPHALGSGGEQSLPVTKGHFRTFASIPRSFPCFFGSRSLLWGGIPGLSALGDHSWRKHEGFLVLYPVSPQIRNKTLHGLMSRGTADLLWGLQITSIWWNLLQKWVDDNVWRPRIIVEWREWSFCLSCRMGSALLDFP